MKTVTYLCCKHTTQKQTVNTASDTEKRSSKEQASHGAFLLGAPAQRGRRNRETTAKGKPLRHGLHEDKKYRVVTKN